MNTKQINNALHKCITGQHPAACQYHNYCRDIAYLMCLVSKFKLKIVINPTKEEESIVTTTSEEGFKYQATAAHCGKALAECLVNYYHYKA